MSQPRAHFASIIYAQLPRQLQEKFTVTVSGDPYGLCLIASFHYYLPNEPDPTKAKVYTTGLDTIVVDGEIKSVKIPDKFLAALCIFE